MKALALVSTPQEITNVLSLTGGIVQLERTAMDDVRFKLDQEEVYEGMSLFDLKQMASSSAYNKVGGNSYLTYLSPNLFSENDVSSARIDFQSTVNANDAFTEAESEIEQAREDIIVFQRNVDAGVDGSQSQLFKGSR